MPGLEINLRITPPFSELAEDIQDAILEGSRKGVDSSLDIIAGTQVESYTKTSRPKQPTGSTYNRTFLLKKSSKKRKAKITNQRVKGVWLSDGSIAPYNIYVLSSDKQAAIHAGRWMTDEELAQDTLPDVQDEIENHIEIELRGI